MIAGRLLRHHFQLSNLFESSLGLLQMGALSKCVDHLSRDILETEYASQPMCCLQKKNGGDESSS